MISIPETMASPEAPRYFSAKDKGRELYALDNNSNVLRRNRSMVSDRWINSGTKNKETNQPMNTVASFVKTIANS